MDFPFKSGEEHIHQMVQNMCNWCWVKFLCPKFILLASNFFWYIYSRKKKENLWEYTSVYILMCWDLTL